MSPSHSICFNFEHISGFEFVCGCAHVSAGAQEILPEPKLQTVMSCLVWCLESN